MAVSHRIQVVDERLQPLSLILPQETLSGKFAIDGLDPWFAPGGLQILFRRQPIAPWLLEAPPLSKWCRAPAPFDEWIYFLAGLAGNRVLLPDILGVWRRHSTSTTGSPEAHEEGLVFGISVEACGLDRCRCLRVRRRCGRVAGRGCRADRSGQRAACSERAGGRGLVSANFRDLAAPFAAPRGSFWSRGSCAHPVRNGAAARLSTEGLGRPGHQVFSQGLLRRAAGTRERAGSLIESPMPRDLPRPLGTTRRTRARLVRRRPWDHSPARPAPCRCSRT